MIRINHSASLATKRGISKSARLAALFISGCERRSIPAPVAEFRFAPDRRWRFDLAWPAFKLAMEIDGGTFVSGRHGRGAGLLKEHEKMNRAACDGWRVLRCVPRVVLADATYTLALEAIWFNRNCIKPTLGGLLAADMRGAG